MHKSAFGTKQTSKRWTSRFDAVMSANDPNSDIGGTQEPFANEVLVCAENVIPIDLVTKSQNVDRDGRADISLFGCLVLQVQEPT